ncbi:hypothetical protein Bca4012_019012 [Brassica carinata]
MSFLLLSFIQFEILYLVSERRFQSFEERMNEMMGCIDRIIAMMDRGSLKREKTKEEVTKKSEVIVSDEPTLNMIQPVTTKEGENEIPLIKSDMKTEVMACDGEDAPLASISDEKIDNMRKKKKKRWRKHSMKAQNRLKGTQTLQAVKINGDGSLKKNEWILNNCLLMTVSKNYMATQTMVYETIVDLVSKKKGKEEDLVASMEKLSQKRRKSAKKKNTRWRFRNWGFVIPRDKAPNQRFGLVLTKKKKGKTKLEYMWVEINPELVLTKYLSRHKRMRKKKTEEWLIAHNEVTKSQEDRIKRLGEANESVGEFKRVKKKKVKTKNKKKRENLTRIKNMIASRMIVPRKTMGDVVVVEDDDKNAGKRKNHRVVEDIDNVVRRNHPTNDPAEINIPRTCSQHTPIVELVVKKVAVPKPKKRAEKPKDVKVMEINSESDEEHGLVVVQEKKTVVSYTSVLTARSKAACCFEKKQKEEIVDIDSADAKIDLAAVEYVEDIYSLYKYAESEWRPSNYMRPKPEINELDEIDSYTEAEGKSMKNETLEDYLSQECPEFPIEILERCKNQKILFDNKTKDKRKKAELFHKLLLLVDSVTMKSNGKPFTDKLFHELQEVAVKLHDQKKEVERLKSYSKREVLDKFKSFKILAEQETRPTIKKIRTDKGGKFVSHELHDYCDKNTRHLTANYSSVRNYLWREYERCAIYLYSKISTRSSMGETPYEGLKGKKPIVEVFRAFGYTGYTSSAGKENCRGSVTFIIGLSLFGSDGLRGIEALPAAGESSQDTRVMSENMINQEEILDREEDESNDDGDEDQEWSQPQLKRSTRVRVRPADMNDYVLITETECERFVMVINEESWIHDGEDMDWSLLTVYGESYSQAQGLYNKIYGPPIYDGYEDDDQIEYGVNEGQAQDNINKVVFHMVKDVQLEQTRDVYAEEVANTVILVFSDKAFDTSLNDTCSYGLTKEIICGECLLTKVPLKSRVTFAFLQRSQLLSYVICGDACKEFVICFEIATSEIPIVGESDGGHRVDLIVGKSVARHIFSIGESLFMWCLSKQESVVLPSCEAEDMAENEAVRQVLYHTIRKCVKYILIEVQRIPENEQRVETLKKALGKHLTLREMRRLTRVQEVHEDEFKLKGENVGLSLKEKESLRNNLECKLPNSIEL